MKSTKYMEKLKGINPKKQNYINSNYNKDDKSSSDNIKSNTNIINEQSNNYLISNNFNTINSSSYLNNKINNKNFINFHKSNNNLKEKILEDEDKMK